MSDKSIADVADNLVNHLANGLEKITDGVSSLGKDAAKIAPEIWKVLVKQQEILGIQSVAYGFFWFITGLIFLYLTIKIVKKRTISQIPDDIFEQDHPLWFFFAIIMLGSIIAPIIVGFHLMGDGFVKCMNPQFYAAKDLIEMIGLKKKENLD